jgi:hypothetical protein
LGNSEPTHGQDDDYAEKSATRSSLHRCARERGDEQHHEKRGQELRPGDSAFKGKGGFEHEKAQFAPFFMRLQ